MTTDLQRTKLPAGTTSNFIPLSIVLFLAILFTHARRFVPVEPYALNVIVLVGIALSVFFVTARVASRSFVLAAALLSILANVVLGLRSSVEFLLAADRLLCLVLYGFLLGLVLHQALQAKRLHAQPVFGILCAFMATGLLFGKAYDGMLQWSPNVFYFDLAAVDTPGERTSELLQYSFHAICLSRYEYVEIMTKAPLSGAVRAVRFLESATAVCITGLIAAWAISRLQRHVERGGEE